MVATDTPDAATDDACGSGGSSGGGAGPSTSGAPERPGSGSGSGSSGGGGGGGSVWRRQAPLLRKLALLSDAGWYGLPLLQLSYALHRAGDTPLSLALLRRALPPQGLCFDALAELRPWHVGALREMLPVAAKHDCWAAVCV
ncbi:hypothetical protein MNEG_15955 [Monoraphidium neglectum]|uniref:Uncharacterized protein n=1 Tax=Monoraphidium neglectum TaxID=145388 RepID=A0A0D2K728_9CHLO|nr:hypothetical protein MNEG_15955 [Monoraphidium neglectum]KIY92008.1 hypothetical protein MNEG_15955 [Monoraphidium neglectum]|eukprot:XP_013891028.1 hypothetical protein MNEG_15955 [Monoraphidium neglectum]